MNQVKFKISQKAAFLDRDGVINVDTGYLNNIEDFKWIEGAIEALKILKKNGFLIIIISNQSGVARGYFSEIDVHNLHNWINLQLAEHNIKIDDFFFATELPETENSKTRRKPSPKMIEEAIEKYNLNRENCFMIGDKDIDVQAAKNAKIRGFLFEGGNLFYKIKKILNIT
ncbi:MAG: D,D-heptose 1,7-bisphosphate phosphatase [Rickettsiales bacterium]|nr:D,D-heptose 1,7-bisphosphate phosphatase [Rickettsiales bacterium]|tara:strand:- start:83 stop:595 length:513 start_codon:yes stop_codon:yes gene_type:complete